MEFKEPTLLGCPWCGAKPNWSTGRCGMRDDPSRYVRLTCPTCHASRSHVADPESHEHSERLSEVEESYPKLKYNYDGLCLIAYADVVAAGWNKRASNN